MNSSITDKIYKKLSIQISLNGMSFVVFNELTQQPEVIENIDLENLEKQTSIEEILDKAFEDFDVLNQKFDLVTIVHNNNLGTFVPKALFDKDFIASYLQYNNKVFDTDFITHDEIANYDMNHVYIPYINFNNFFIDKFGSFDYKHSSTILVSKILDLSKNIDYKKMIVHVAKKQFEIVVVQNQKLLFFNSFSYQTPQDFIYYILFTAEQLQLNPESFLLEFLGTIEKEDPFFEIAYKYIRNVDFFRTDNHFISVDQIAQREHFILLNS